MNPQLTEPGTKYFLSETLKMCNTKKQNKHTLLFNAGLLLLFISTLLLYLAYKYNTKPGKKELEEKNILTRNYILSKLRNIVDTSKKKMITTLPKFESDYELLHEKFYNV